MKKQKKQKLKMKFWMKLHAIFTIFLLLFYVVVGTFGGFGMLSSDLQAKYIWAAGVNLNIVIDGLPGKPIMTATKTCPGHVSSINLAWTGSDGATSNLLTRDGVTLASGFQSLSFVDSNVVAGESYSYVVTASGFGGEAISDPLVVQARDCLIPELPDPTLTLVSFDGKEVFPGDILSTDKKTFKLTGITNMPSANIQIKTFPGPLFVSTLQANEVGYWEYNLPGELVPGSYSFQIIAADPAELLRSVTNNYFFSVTAPVPIPEPPTPPTPEPPPVPPVERDREHHHSADRTTNNSTAANKPIGSASENSQQLFPTKLMMNLKNKAGRVFRSQAVQFDLFFLNQERVINYKEKQVFNFKYEILNKKNAVVFSNKVVENVLGDKLEKTIQIPKDLPNGNYLMRASLTDGDNILSSERVFIFEDMPILAFGGGITISRVQLVSYLGWVFIISAILLVFFIFMFLLEYYFFKESLFTVDERNLFKKGMLGRRRGVPK